MAVFGHSGSHAPQLMHSLVMTVAIAAVIPPPGTTGNSAYALLSRAGRVFPGVSASWYRRAHGSRQERDRAHSPRLAALRLELERHPRPRRLGDPAARDPA